jgi:hypothetical protein
LQAETTASVLRRARPHGETQMAGHVDDRFLNHRPFRDHHFAVSVANVVEVDVNREPRRSKHEQVEHRAAVEAELQLQRRMPTDPLQDHQQPDNLADDLGLETAEVERGHRLSHEAISCSGDGA